MIETARPIVYVVDDDQAVRKTLHLLMRTVGHEVACYDSAESFLAAYDPQIPGCLLLDVRMTGMGGIELQNRLITLGFDIPIIMITGHGDIPMAVQAVRKGAVDFLEKPFREKVLLDCIDKALHLDAQRRGEQARIQAIAHRIASLTPREKEVMEMVVRGYSTKEIAAEFGVSGQAVDARRGKLMKKMQADSVAELVAMVLSTRKSVSRISSTEP